MAESVERILIVGLGSIGRRHARIARVLMPSAQIVGMRREQSSTPEVDEVVTSLDEALRFRPQVAVIASPSTKHLDTALPLADAGVHLLVEKPIAATSAGVSKLIDMSRARATTLLVGYNLRFAPSLQRLRQLVHDGVVGRILSVRVEVGQYLPNWRPGTDFRHGVSARSDLGGGVLLELSHELDYLRWLFGEIEWVSASLRRASSLPIDVEDTAHLVLGFDPDASGNGLVAVVNMDFIRHDSTRSCTIIGETGTLRWNAVAGTVEHFLAGATSWVTDFARAPDRDQTYTAEWQHFLDCVRGDDQTLITGDDGLAVVRMVEAARRSAAAGVATFLDARLAPAGAIAS